MFFSEKGNSGDANNPVKHKESLVHFESANDVVKEQQGVFNEALIGTVEYTSGLERLNKYFISIPNIYLILLY